MRSAWMPLLLLLVMPALRGADDDAAFFTQKVSPILHDSCIRCHGPEKQKGHLRLDSRTAVLAGGKSGAGAVSGKPDDSLLIKAVRYQDDDLQMPPRKQLPQAQIDILVEWVKRGLPWPDAQGAATHP